MHGPRRAIKSVMLRDNRNFVLLDGGERASRRILDAVTCLDLRVIAMAWLCRQISAVPRMAGMASSWRAHGCDVRDFYAFHTKLRAAQYTAT